MLTASNVQLPECFDKRVTRSYAKKMSTTEQIQPNNESTATEKRIAKSAQKQSKNETSTQQKRQSSEEYASKQICSLPNFRVGDIVFVHLKGYNNWPAKILEMVEKRKRYYVEFFEFKSRKAFVYRSQITDFVGGLRSETIRSQIRKNNELERYTKEAMVHVFGRMIQLE